MFSSSILCALTLVQIPARRFIITFATPDHNDAAKLLIKSFLDVGRFDGFQIFSLSDLDVDFRTRNENILSQKRGAGYWLYKPYILHKFIYLNATEDDEVCYSDARYQLLQNPDALMRRWFNGSFVALMGKKPNMAMFYERNWSKRDAFILMNSNETHARVTRPIQLWAGFVCFKKCFATFQFLAEWLVYCQDKRIIDDSRSILGAEFGDVTENRQDQTILSLLSKRWNLKFHFISESVLENRKNKLDMTVNDAKKKFNFTDDTF